MERREFCLHACQAASFVTLGSLLEGCGGGPTSPSSSISSSNVPQLSVVNGSASSGAVVVNIDANSPLAAVGGAALIHASGGSFLVTRTAQDAFTALTAICTHEQCEITGFASARFVCGCHGSQFSTTGSVTNGPATQALRRFSTTFANNVLTIALV